MKSAAEGEQSGVILPPLGHSHVPGGQAGGPQATVGERQPAPCITKVWPLTTRPLNKWLWLQMTAAMCGFSSLQLPSEWDPL